MAIQTVKVKVNGVVTPLTLNTTTGKYEATIAAPATTSWPETDHKYNVEVTATDTAGNSTVVDRTDPTLGGDLQLRVLEKVSPAITPVYPAPSAHISNNQPEISWKILDSGSGVDTSTVKIKIDTDSFVVADSTEPIEGGVLAKFTPTSAFTDGNHSATFSAYDNDGNGASGVSIVFTVDTVAPTLDVTSPADNSITNNPTCTVAGTTNDAMSSPVTVKINGVSATVAADGTFSKDITLTEGVNTLNIVATDTAGKSTTVTRTVTLDTTPPVITAVTITPNPVDVGQTYVISVEVTD